MDTKAKTAKQALIATQWILDNKGWVKGRYERYSDEGDLEGFCLSGALNRVVMDDSVRQRTRKLLEAAIENSSRPDLQYITNFNDNYTTTKQDIDNLIKSAMEMKVKGSKK